MINDYIREHYPDLVLSRFDALRFGFGVFRTGEPCVAGHRDFRRTDTGACIPCIKEIGLCVSCKLEPKTCGEKSQQSSHDPKSPRGCAQWLPR